MTPIQKIIEKYQNAEELIALIKEFQLETVINKAIMQVEAKLKGNQTGGLPQLAGFILTDINSHLKKITDPEKKQKIKYLFGDVFQGYLNEISKTSNATATLAEIQASMQTACEYGDFDQKDLFSYINIQKQQVLLPKGNERKIYYDWNGEPEELDEIAKDLYDKKIIFSVKEFKRLFKPVSGKLNVRCNRAKINELLLLFQVFKDHCLITPRGNSGHFAPFVEYSRDNDGLFLIENSANKEHERIKKDKPLYHKLRAKIEEIVRGHAGKSMRQRIDNGRCPPFEQAKAK